MGMKDEIQRVRATELRKGIDKLRREYAYGQPEPVDQMAERKLIRELLEVVAHLQDQMETVTERLDRLERQSG
jgi:ubiquinone biosynthesis protein UbiJ